MKNETEKEALVKRMALVRIVDDDPAVCRSLAFMLGSKGWRTVTYAGAEQFLKSDAHSEPGCIILDVRMPGISGLELQEMLNERGSKLPIIFFTAHGTVDMAVQTLHAGAADFVMKPLDVDRIVSSVAHYAELSVRDASPLSLMSRAEAARLLERLTDRERQILGLAAEGLSCPVIAQRLAISEKTVENHRTSVCKKLNVPNLDAVIDILAIAEGDADR